MRVKEAIEAKRDGLELSPSTIQSLIDGFVAGEVRDYHMAAWLMAVYFRGLSESELTALTSAMWRSGESLPRRDCDDYWVDKHSTGGVGDKPSLILVPWLVSTARRVLGAGKLRVPMISGRGLGHSGGTLDKLESVRGFSPQVALADALDLLERRDYFMLGQSETLAPADRRLYALRDVTGTVDCLPLIVSSILSKKLAESLNGLVLDVKFGSGAFMRSQQDGRALAAALLDVTRAHGVEGVALLTRMDEPLGLCVGNLLEVEESHDFLTGVARDAGLLEVTLGLAGWMLHLGSRGGLSLEAAAAELVAELESRRPVDEFRRMFESQGGRFDEYEARRGLWRKEMSTLVWNAPAAGSIQSIEPRAVGELLNSLGGGRAAKEDAIDHRVGLQFCAKVGDVVAEGDPIVTVYHRDPGAAGRISAVLARAISLGATSPEKKPWIVETLT